MPLTFCPGLSQSLRARALGLAGCAWGRLSPCLIVTSCWVSSGRLMVAVDSGGTVVLVSQDGIQRPPFHFPKGGHLLQFLSCLENGLLPHGQLDPPLWSQRGKVSDCGGPWSLEWGSAIGSDRSCSQPPMWPRGFMHAPRRPSSCAGCGDRCVPGTTHWDVLFQGKVFPKLRKRSPQGSSESTSSDKEDDEATDYVFRIIYPGMQSEFGELSQSWVPGAHPLVGLEIDFSYMETAHKRCGFWG